jgi:hypothetical protein
MCAEAVDSYRRTEVLAALPRGAEALALATRPPTVANRGVHQDWRRWHPAEDVFDAIGCALVQGPTLPTVDPGAHSGRSRDHAAFTGPRAVRSDPGRPGPGKPDYGWRDAPTGRIRNSGLHNPVFCLSNDEVRCR